MSPRQMILPLLALLALAALPALAGGKTTPEDKSFQLSLTAPPSLRVGADGVAVLKIQVDSAFHWNKDYPAKATIAEGGATAGPVTIGKREFKQLKGDFSSTEQSATVEIPLTAKTAGRDTLRVDTRFSICNERMCLIKKASVNVALAVSP